MRKGGQNHGKLSMVQRVCVEIPIGSCKAAGLANDGFLVPRPEEDVFDGGMEDMVDS